MPFYSDISTEPKRSFRYIFTLAGAATVPNYTVVSVTKPNFQMEGGPEVKYIQHTFKYPGRVMWQDVTVTVIDPGGAEDNTSKIMNVLAGSGYSLPKTQGAARPSISKAKSNAQIGKPRVTQIDANGNAIEEFTLVNAFLTQANFGELSYDSDEIVKVQLTFKYDYAEFSVGPGVSPSPFAAIRASSLPSA